jgi:hypothetical protein
MSIIISDPLPAGPAGPLLSSGLKKIRDSHHALAQAVASGRKHVEIAAETGYSQSRISILLKDPAFGELVAHYREKKAAVFVDTHRRLKALLDDVVAELHERVDEPEISTGELLEIAKFSADRAGFGPSSKTLNLTATVDLTELKRKAEEAERGRLVGALEAVSLPLAEASAEGDESAGAGVPTYFHSGNPPTVSGGSSDDGRSVVSLWPPVSPAGSDSLLRLRLARGRVEADADSSLGTARPVRRAGSDDDNGAGGDGAGLQEHQTGAERRVETP